jgi:hypothetical protein
MRALLAVMTVAAMCGIASAEEIVEIPYAPEVGSQWAVEEVLTRSRTDENGAQTHTIGTIRGVLVIERMSATGFDATWTTESVEAGGVVIDAANGGVLMIGVPLGLSLDRDGAPSAVRDWQSVLRRIIDAVEAVEQNPAAASTCQGIAEVPGVPVDADGYMTSGLGGPPILVRERFELASVDRDRGVALIRFSQALDPDSAAASMREGMQRLARDAGRPLDEVITQFEGGLSHTTTVSCETDLETGVPRSVTHEVHARTGPAEQRERREITIRRRS